MKLQAPGKRSAGAMAIAVVFVAGFEGIRQNAYRDPIGVVTVCAGETQGVKMGDRYTLEECRAMLARRLGEYYDGVRGCVTAPMSDPQAAAFTSLAYNIGVGAFCKSSVVRNFNAGNVRDACNSMLKFNRAGGIVFPGLTRRREQERKLCLEGPG